MELYPYSRNTPIAHIESLAKLLEITQEELLYVTENKNELWLPGKKEIKKNGKVRITHNAKPRLKIIHQKILDKLLKNVYYPPYLQGGIADPINPRSCNTNALSHCHQSIVISEDIMNFFPNCNEKNIHSIWQGFFCMAPHIAKILTELTTYKGILPQGWKTSSYLANLIFYDVEPKLFENLAKRQLSYSRYIDDITVSSKRVLTPKQKTKIISDIYCTFYSKGHQPNRKKQTIYNPSVNGKGQTVTGLTINSKKPTIHKSHRKKLRAAIHQLKLRYTNEKNLEAYYRDWCSVRSKVGQTKSSHPKNWKKYKVELEAIKPTFKIAKNTKKTSKKAKITTSNHQE